jgi:hypothetical protein
MRASRSHARMQRLIDSILVTKADRCSSSHSPRDFSLGSAVACCSHQTRQEGAARACSRDVSWSSTVNSLPFRHSLLTPSRSLEPFPPQSVGRYGPRSYIGHTSKIFSRTQTQPEICASVLAILMYRTSTGTETKSKRCRPNHRLSSRRLRDLAFATAEKQRIPLFEGVYAASSGPTYETPAEVFTGRWLGRSHYMNSNFNNQALRCFCIRHEHGAGDDGSTYSRD